MFETGSFVFIGKIIIIVIINQESVALDWRKMHA